MICYETIFPAEIMRRAGVGDWMVQVTNDAWFGNHIGPYQHYAMARVRAIERGLPLARAANTGISAVIDGYGRPTAQLDLNESGVVLTSLPRKARETLYSWREDQLFGAIMILIACLNVAALFSSRKYS
jgi:apolipoprotein N-acyltransferase